jgi:UDP-N-acetylglucosamine 4,6-dehydratase/5-epimerase
MFKGKTLLITGGTGSFGNAVLERFLKSDLKELRIFSRDERTEDGGQRTEDGEQMTPRLNALRLC